MKNFMNVRLWAAILAVFFVLRFPMPVADGVLWCAPVLAGSLVNRDFLLSEHFLANQTNPDPF